MIGERPLDRRSATNLANKWETGAFSYTVTRESVTLSHKGNKGLFQRWW